MQDVGPIPIWGLPPFPLFSARTFNYFSQMFFGPLRSKVLARVLFYLCFQGRAGGGETIKCNVPRLARDS